MPRSKDPRNYSKMFGKLIQLMEANTLEITIPTSGAKALLMRGNFYSLINAYKHTYTAITPAKIKQNPILRDRVDEALRHEETMRNYMVVIDPIDKGPDESKREVDWPRVNIRFIYRHMDPRMADIDDTLDSIIASERPAEKIEAFKAALNSTASAKPIVDRKSAVGTPMESLMPTPGQRPNVDMDKPIIEPPAIPATTLEDLLPPVADTEQAQEQANEPTESDPITPSNQAASPPRNFMEEAMKSAEKLRLKEREESENSS